MRKGWKKALVLEMNKVTIWKLKPLSKTYYNQEIKAEKLRITLSVLLGSIYKCTIQYITTYSFLAYTTRPHVLWAHLSLVEKQSLKVSPQL